MNKKVERKHFAELMVLLRELFPWVVEWPEGLKIKKVSEFYVVEFEDLVYYFSYYALHGWHYDVCSIWEDEYDGQHFEITE